MQAKKARGVAALVCGLFMAACSFSVDSTADEPLPSGTVTQSNELDPAGSAAVQGGVSSQSGSASGLASQSSGGEGEDLMAPLRVGANLAFNGFDDTALGVEIGHRTRVWDSDWVFEAGGVFRAYRGQERFGSGNTLSLAVGPQGRLYYAGLRGMAGLDAVQPWVGLGAGGAYAWGVDESDFSWYYETRFGVTAQVSDQFAIDVFYSDVEFLDGVGPFDADLSSGSTFNVGCSFTF